MTNGYKEVDGDVLPAYDESNKPRYPGIDRNANEEALREDHDFGELGGASVAAARGMVEAIDTSGTTMDEEIDASAAHHPSRGNDTSRGNPEGRSKTGQEGQTAVDLRWLRQHSSLPQGRRRSGGSRG